MNQQRSFFFNVDWVTVLLYLALCAIGIINIHSAEGTRHSGLFDMDTNSGKQFVFVISGLVLALVILLLESRFLSALAPTAYGITVFLLLLVLVLGHNVNGNAAWISLGGGFKLQPSEFAKLATALMLARYLSSTNVRVTELKSFAIACAIIGFPMLLILRQPDVGSTLVFCSFIFVLYREGLSPYFLIIGALFIFLFVAAVLFNPFYIIAGLVAFVLLAAWLFKRNRKFLITLFAGLLLSVAFIFCVKTIYKSVLQPHQRDRIDIILGVKKDDRGKGYNLKQSLIAIGSGKMWGKGYLHGTQTKYSFVPEQSTDFIFCTVGEEFGFAGSIVVLGLYLFLLLRLIVIAERQRSPFSRIYGYGVASIVFFHVMINIGMTIGLVPVIGIPLPLVSYGGSSLWSFTILLFILVKLDSNRMGMIYA